MSDAAFNSVVATINVGSFDFKANGKTPLFDGYQAALATEKPKDKKEKEEQEEVDENTANKILPKLEVCENLDAKNLTATQKFTKAPARYNDGSLVDAMKEKGIGRPATYKPTLDTLYGRFYVERDGKHMKPTELGMTVCDLLVENFPDIINVAFTAEMEDKLDNIEDGGKVWQDEIAQFYKDFEASLKKAGENTEKIRIAPELSDEVCVVCGKQMAIRNGKWGKFLGCIGYPECKTLKKIEKIVGKCPDCEAGVAQKRSKKGTPFYGCTAYPACTFISWNIPLDTKCPKCKTRLELKKLSSGDLEVCASKECDYKKLIKKEEEA
jgi:DNA topoisomerase-1